MKKAWVVEQFVDLANRLGTWDDEALAFASTGQAGKCATEIEKKVFDLSHRMPASIQRSFDGPARDVSVKAKKP